jgi:type I restriction enzyme S subunit
MDTKKLRQKILDLAIRGKLVPQDPNDEPASVLLERIRAEKERLIQEGKIKRSKKTASDDEIEAPFEIPESWEWCRLNEVGEIVTGGTPPKEHKEYYGGNMPFFKPTDLEQGINTYSSIDTLTKEGFAVARKIPANSILVTCIGATIGKTGLIRTEGACNQQINAVITYTSIISEFIYYICVSNYMQTCIIEKASATTLPILNKNHFSEILIPLSPKEEQKRIVDEVERWFTLIDELESNEGDLLKAIDKAKSKILDLAIHGKLVPQDPNDEPAIELLKRINPDFEACDEEDCPYTIPQSWEWVSGIDIFESMKSSSPSGETFKYIDIDAVDNKCHQIISIKHIQTKDAPSRASRYTERGNVLFSMVRPYLRNIAMVPEDGCIASTGFFVCREKSCLNNSFCLYLMLSNYVVDGLNAFMKGDNSPSINKSQIESFLFPLPPVEEQLRIVAKIEELFAILDSIKESLEA